MHLSLTLSRYIGREFLVAIGMAFFVLTALIMVVDFLELARRGAGRDEASLWVLVQMVLLHTPYLSQRVVPLAVLMGVMLALSRLTRTSELVVARAAGVSVWQFLLPGLAIALLVGVFVVAAFNPLASLLLSRYEQMDARYISAIPSQVATLSGGLWLRQIDADGEAVVHAGRVSPAEMRLEEVIIFRFDGEGRFAGRVDAERAYLEDGYWRLEDALVTSPDQPAERRDSFRLDTDLTISRIQESFASPSTLPVWALPGFIRTLEAAGFSAVKHRLHFHALLSGPLLLCGLVLVGAAFSLRLTRRGGTGILLVCGLIVGFLLYFFSDLVLAFGISARLPAMLAAWSPAAVAAMLGLGTLLHFEEG